MELLIRPYQPADRAAVRAVSCETADRGGSIEPILRDRELVADLLTGYYTDSDPAATWVAEAGVGVVGYLTGCLDTRRYHRAMRWSIAPHALMAAVWRGALGSAQLWRVAGASLSTWQGGGFRRRIPLARFPAHLHVNVSHAFRGQHVGRRLVEQFLSQARAAGAGGVHASVRGDNPAACRFFEAMGFTVISRHPVVWPEGTAYRSHEALMYGRALS